MTNAHYFGDETLDFGLEAGDGRNLARRQFMFLLIIGALLLASAALVGAHPFGADRPNVALHQIKLVAPAPAEAIALPNALSAPQG